MPPKKKTAPKKKEPADDATEQLYKLCRKHLHEQGARMPRKLEEKFSDIRDEKNPRDFEVFSIWEDIGVECFRAIITAFTALKYNRVQEIHIWQGNIVDQGMRLLANYLKETATVRVLDIQNSRLGPLACGFIGQVMAAPAQNTLTSLVLDYNEFGDEGLELLSQGLSQNNGLQYLSLAFCSITGEGARYIMEILINITTCITELNLQGNQLRNLGAVVVLKALAANCSVAFINFADNQLGEEDNVLEALRHLLYTNTSLKVIDLSRNGFYDAGGQYILNIFTDLQASLLNIKPSVKILLPNSIDPAMQRLIEKAQKDLKKKGKKKVRKRGKR